MRKSQALVARSTKFYSVARYFWVFSMGIASCDPPGAQNFEVSPIFLENLWTFTLDTSKFIFKTVLQETFWPQISEGRVLRDGRTKETHTVVVCV